jgi:hypothetical protein
MLASIIRFHERFSLPSHLEFKLKSASEINNKTLLDCFNKHRTENKPILELYHSSRFGETAINGIIKNGFRTTELGNKGPGIYLANHAKYSIWAGYPLHSIICHVVADDNFVTRFDSEIKSVPWSSEFVVINPELIYPKYILHFQIKNNNMNIPIMNNFEYIKKNKQNCTSDDCKKKWRCDCPRYPLVLKNDIVDIDY